MERLRGTKQMENRALLLPYKRGPLRSFTANDLLNLSWKPWTGGIFDGQFRAKLKFFLGRDRSIASKNVHGLPNIRNFQVHFPPRNAIIQFILLINKFVARESNCFFFTILIYKFKTIR